jgi:hypothetical protein
LSRFRKDERLSRESELVLGLLRAHASSHSGNVPLITLLLVVLLQGRDAPKLLKDDGPSGDPASRKLRLISVRPEGTRRSEPFKDPDLELRFSVYAD